MASRRLIFALGTWQLTLLSAALRQEASQLQAAYDNYLVLYGDWLPNQMKQSMMQLATAAWNWQGVVWADDLLIIPYSNNYDLSLLMQLLRERVGVSNVDEIWVCKLYDPPEKFILETYSQSSVVLYEDGLGAYLPIGYTCNGESLFHHASCIKKAGGICSKHPNRLARIYLFLTAYLPLPQYLSKFKVIQIDKENLLKAIRNITDELNVKTHIKSLKSKQTVNCILLLGQAFSKWNLMSFSEEKRLYCTAISTLNQLGFTVIWKEHPRADKSFFTELAKETHSAQLLELNIPFSWPIEFVGDQLDIIGCVSVESTSFFTLHELFGILPYTLANQVGEWHREDTYISAKWMSERIPTLNSIAQSKVHWHLPRHLTYCFSTVRAEESLFTLEKSISSPKFLNWLSVSVEQYQNSSDKSVLAELRRIREQVAAFWLSAPEAQVEIIYLSYIGKAHQLLLNSGIREDTVTATEQNFIDELSIQVSKGFNEPKAINYILAAMLYCRADQLPLKYDISCIPKWMFGDYMKFMFYIPPYFQEMGGADSYYRYMQKWVDYLHRFIFNQPNSALSCNVATYFLHLANFTPVYLNQTKLKDIFVKRSQIINFVLNINMHEVDYDFDDRSVGKKKIRLGILAEHFRPAPETYASLSVYECLSRDFEIILYSLVSTGHPLEQYCKSCANSFKLLPKDLNDQVNCIRGDELDILLITTNATAVANQICLLALHRLSRIQISSISSVVTTGIRNVDYYISSKVAASLGNIEQHYQENLLKLDGIGYCFSYGNEQKNILKPDRESLKIHRDDIVFISGANMLEITPELSNSWANIIASVPNSVLIIYPFLCDVSKQDFHVKQSFTEHMNAIFVIHGLTKERWMILEPNLELSFDKIKNDLRIADVYIDAYTFSDIASLIAPLEVGLPIVVRQGISPWSSVGAGLLQELNMPDLVADSEESYIELAITLGTDSELRQKKRDEIKVKMQSNPRFLDSHSYSREIGSLFRELLQTKEQSIISDRLNLRDINFIVFPDWNQPEESLGEELAAVIMGIATQSEKERMTLLIDTSNVSEEDANIIISGVIMNLLMQEDLEMDDEPEISLVGQLSVIQWEALLPRLHARIVLENENQQAITQANAEKIPFCKIDNIRDKQVVQLETGTWSLQ